MTPNPSPVAFKRDLALYALYAALTFALAWEGNFTWRFYVGIAAAVVGVLKAKLSPGKPVPDDSAVKS